MIIKPEVFDDRRLPRDLQHREREVEVLSRALDPALHDRAADDILIAGPSGVGKTTLAGHTLGRLDDFAHVPHAHIRCGSKTTGSILRTTLQDYPGDRSVPRNMSVDDAVAQLRETVTRPYVLVLDEGSDLPEIDVLSRLTSLSMVSIVVICHKPRRWLADVSGSVRERIARTLHVERFSVTELASILRRRAELGLQPDVVRGEQLRAIADEVAGNARRGIQSLRSAAELAVERGHATIQPVDVTESFEHAKHRIRKANLRSLSFHHHVLYALLHEPGELVARELHQRYREKAETVYYGRERMPVQQRARRNKLSKLREYELVEWDDEVEERVYRVVDASVEPLIDV